jgi:hypothetical protein
LRPQDFAAGQFAAACRNDRAPTGDGLPRAERIVFQRGKNAFAHKNLRAGAFLPTPAFGRIRGLFAFDPLCPDQLAFKFARGSGNAVSNPRLPPQL